MVWQHIVLGAIAIALIIAADLFSGWIIDRGTKTKTR